MISQATKFEVRYFTGYENMKGVAKCKSEVVWGG